ncbi:MAG: LytR C-terminal domain-containing protein [Candidatus Paceibacterota bacterium]|jgi:hypothetical protein
MTSSTKTLRERISEVTPGDLIYPGIGLIFFIIVIIIFFASTQFLSKNINNAFTGDTGTNSSLLDMTNYNLVARKLGIEAGTQSEAVTVSPTSSAVNTESATTTQDTEKSTLSIKILNSSTQKGVAGKLATALEDAGYAKATTGNQSKKTSTTTITIKESASSFGPSILEEVKKLYPEAIAATTTETADSDVTIVIGGK